MRRPKPLLLLTYLAMEGTKLRQHLSELFFSEARDAADALGTTLRRLRAAGGFVHEDGGLVSCALSCDAKRVQDLLDQRRIREALREYSAPFLQDVDGDLTPELEEWVYGTREALAERVRLGHLLLAENLTRAGRYGDAADQINHAAHLPAAPEPHAEVWARLHTVALAAGHPLEAWLARQARSYDLALMNSRASARAALVGGDGLDVPEAPAVWQEPGHEVRSGSPFIGRAEELEGLLGMLRRGTPRLITLWGPGGVGKSSLAREVLKQARQERIFPDGAYFVALETVTDASGFTSAVAAALPIQLQGSEPPGLQLRRFLARRRLLIALDNFEQLVAESHRLKAWSDAAPGLVILVTSRESLQVEGEHLHRVSGLDWPQGDVTIDEAVRFDAVRLFTSAARRRLREFRLDAAEVGTVRRLCEMVDGLPLALELAAATLAEAGLAQVVAALEVDPLLESDMPHLAPRHRRLRATLSRSWQLLNPTERSQLDRLGLFAGSFRHAAAAEVTDATLPDLTALVAKSLLSVTLDGRYEFHPLVRQYALERLAGRTAQRQETEARHARYYVRFLEDRVTEMLDSDTATRAARAIREELPNIRAAWRWALNTQRLDLIETASEALTHFAEIRSAQSDVLALFEEAFDKLGATEEPLGPLVVNDLLGASSLLLYRVGDNVAALENAEKAQAVLTALPPKLRNAGTWAAWYGAGLTAMLAGRFRPDYFEGAIGIARADLERVKLRDAPAGARRHARSLLGLGLSGWGMVLNVLGDFETAAGRLTEAREVLEPLGSPYLALTYRLLHEIAFAAGEHADARRWLGLGLEVAQASGYHTEVTTLRCFLARLLFTVGEAREARRMAGLVEAAVAQSGDRYVAAFLATWQGWMAVQGGDIVTARARFETAIESALAIRAKLVAMEPLAGLAQTYALAGDAASAATILGALMAHGDSVPYLVRRGVEEASAAAGGPPVVHPAERPPPELAHLLNRVWA